MKMVNTHPSYGYYASREAFGLGGDFITAPDISQLFGEMIGVCILNFVESRWNSLGMRGIRITELGPGRGTLASDMLRVS